MLTAKAHNGKVLSLWMQRCFEELMTRYGEFNDAEEQAPLLYSCLYPGSKL